MHDSLSAILDLMAEVWHGDRPQVSLTLLSPALEQWELRIGASGQVVTLFLTAESWTMPDAEFCDRLLWPAVGLLQDRIAIAKVRDTNVHAPE